MSTRKPTTLWVRITVKGDPQWINTHHIRQIGQDHSGRAQFVYTTRHIVTADQSLATVMEALGYKEAPPPPPLKTHNAPALEHQPESEFVAEVGLNRKEP